MKCLQEEGEEAQLELPGGKGPQLPFVAPPPLRTPLLDATVPLSLPALWLAFFHNASSLLADFHQRLGDRDVHIASWRRLKGAPLRPRVHPARSHCPAPPPRLPSTLFACPSISMVGLVSHRARHAFAG
jgi:hypothetical protein